MATNSLATKLMKNPQIQMVLSPSGEPTHLQIPWSIVLSLTEDEKETLEILSDPWWGKALPKRLRGFREDPKKAFIGAVSFNQYRVNQG